MRILLELSPDAETLEGSASLDGGPARAFTGWIGFNAAIDALLAEGARRTPTTCVAVLAPAELAHTVERLTAAGATVREFSGPAGADLVCLMVEAPDVTALEGLESTIVLRDATASP